MGQPAAQRAEVEVDDLGLAETLGVLQQAGDVGEVGTHRVRCEVALGDQVPLVVGEHPRLIPRRARHAVTVGPGDGGSGQPRRRETEPEEGGQRSARPRCTRSSTKATYAWYARASTPILMSTSSRRNDTFPQLSDPVVTKRSV